MQTKPRVGFMALTWPGLYEASTETGEAWIQMDDTMQAINGLEETGELDLVVHKETVVSEIDEALKVVDRFLDEDCDCMVLFVQTWNWASRIMQAAERFGRPIVLWALPIPRQWSIGGLAVTHGSFDEVGIEHIVAYGMPDDPSVKEDIIRYARAARVKNVLRKSHFGSIGGQGMGIHTGPIDANQWMREFGILVGYSDLYDVVNEGEKCTIEEVQAYYEQLKSEYGEVPPLDETTERSIRLYFGLEKVIEREGYDFTGVNDMNGLSDAYCSMCLAQSRLSSRGFVTACLNDSNGALTMYILRLLSDGPLFTADVNLVDKARGVVRLIDDGAGSIHLAEDPKDVRLSYQPKLECKASGVCTGLVAKSGRVTLARLARVEGAYVMQLAPGEAFEGDPGWVDECGYPMWPHAFLHLDGDLKEFVRNLRSEYIHMAYGDMTEDLLEVCRLLDIKPIVT
jgi:L-fucose isomerase